MIFNPNSPVEPRGYEIQIRKSDNKTICLIEFYNLSQKTLTTLEFTLRCYNAFGEPIGQPPKNEFTVLLQDINVDTKKSFGDDRPVIMSDHPGTRKIEAIINKVMFSDGSKWEYDKNDLVEVNIEKLQGEELDQLKAVAGEDAVCYAKEEANYWICVCGKVNSHDNEICIRCERVKKEVVTFNDPGNINYILQKSKEQEEAEMKITMEQEQKAIDKNAKASLKNGFITLFFIFVIIFFDILSIANSIGLPVNVYIVLSSIALLLLLLVLILTINGLRLALKGRKSLKYKKFVWAGIIIYCFILILCLLIIFGMFLAAFGIME